MFGYIALQVEIRHYGADRGVFVHGWARPLVFREELQERSVQSHGGADEAGMFVDHARSGRSGHLGHALVEYAPGKILAFVPRLRNAGIPSTRPPCVRRSYPRSGLT